MHRCSLSKAKQQVDGKHGVHCPNTFKEANLCRPRGYEGLDPLQVHLDGFSVCYLLGQTQFKNHLQQMGSPQGKLN